MFLDSYRVEFSRSETAGMHLSGDTREENVEFCERIEVDDNLLKNAGDPLLLLKFQRAVT